MVDNYNIKSEEFANLFGSKRRKELAKTKAELESVKASQQELENKILAQNQQPSLSSSTTIVDAKKPNLLLWGGIALVVVVGGILLINRK
jgi:hypothetical protein